MLSSLPPIAGEYNLLELLDSSFKCRTKVKCLKGFPAFQLIKKEFIYYEFRRSVSTIYSLLVESFSFMFDKHSFFVFFTKNCDVDYLYI